MTGPLPNDQFPTETFRGCADGRTASQWRTAVMRWFSDHIDIDGERSADVALAVYEALANCADHAYRHNGTGGSMAMQVEHDAVDDAVKISVTDEGRWIDPDGAGPDSTRGRGLVLMYSLADACSVEGGANGTTVCLQFNECPARNEAGQTRAG